MDSKISPMATKHHKLAKAKQIFENTLDLDTRNNLTSAVTNTASLPVVAVTAAETVEDEYNSKKRKNEVEHQEVDLNGEYIVVSADR